MSNTLGKGLKNVSNSIVKVFKDKDLSKRIFFTLFALLVYKLLTYIPAPFIDQLVAAEAFNKLGETGAMAQAISGGSLKQFSIIALGVSPYITASIVIQLLQMDIIPLFAQWKDEGETGRQKLNQATRYLALFLAFVQSLAISFGFNYQLPVIMGEATPLKYVYIAIVMTAGTAFLLWLADQITAKGIGNGTSMIIAAGIISSFPKLFNDLYYINDYIENLPTVTFTYTELQSRLIFVSGIILLVLIILAVIFMHSSVRKIPIQYANRGNAANLSGKKDAHIPIKLNSAGVIPVIFAATLVSLPLTIIRFFPAGAANRWLNYIFNNQEPLGLILYIVLIYLFSFFYSFIQVSPEKISDNLRKQGSYIPGIRPGRETENYISGVLARTTVVGSTYLVIIAVFPILLGKFLHLPPSVQIGGTSLLIVVGVAIEVAKQIETKSKERKYTGFIK
ncbi:preprotein translocase subunit SecY [Haloplasma contractile]|uniref:Protein translocase subunit SecY n=1 Tax=Haloplasma contractile SSD-17B TaxID=1033810 RepID=U2EB91_9MOLU|nr:preprotein translocase subunit SecY [Haloplasma contractile]ERJ12368.1 Protein translocase subunit SecY [Haloplasma contractile SSD-17B]